MFGHRSYLQLLWFAEGFGTSTILTLGEGLSQVTFWSSCAGGWSPLVPASARAELLHQSKGMKLSPAFQSHLGAVVGSQNPEMASVQPCFSSPL